MIAINDGVDTITRSSADDFNIMVKNLMNDNYCRDISIKIRSQLQVKRKNGEFIGAFAPYGYEKSPEDKNKLMVDVYAAEVVRDIFGWKLSGINQDAIARRLNEQSILSPLEYKRSKGLPYKHHSKRKAKRSGRRLQFIEFLPTRFMLERLYKEFGLDPIIKSKQLSSMNRISGQFTKTHMKRS